MEDIKENQNNQTAGNSEETTPKAEEPKTNEPESNIPEDERILSAIGYLGPLCVLPLFLKPKSKYCQFHGKQGLIMMLIWIAFLILFAAIPIFGIIFFFFMLLILFSMYNAYMGKMWKIPVVGDFAEKFDLNKTISDMANNIKESTQKKDEPKRDDQKESETAIPEASVKEAEKKDEVTAEEKKENK